MKFYTEKDMAMCGLACVLCSAEDCSGCKSRGCRDESDCSVCQCVRGKKLDGCYECNDFPCDEKMLQGTRNRAFNRYARQYGKQELLTRLRINFENGIVYHAPDGLKGDYDLLTTEEDIIRLIRFGTHDPYVKCPVLETDHFKLRLVETEDAEDLLRCYSDPKSQAIFNSDRCTSDFRYLTPDDMKECIYSWVRAYEQQEFVRFTVTDKSLNRSIGTIEMFGMLGKYKTQRGILRLDVASMYEKQKYIEELLEVCVSSFYELFAVNEIATKAIPEAEERISSLRTTGFELLDWSDGEREHYWIRERNERTAI